MDWTRPFSFFWPYSTQKSELEKCHENLELAKEELRDAKQKLEELHALSKLQNIVSQTGIEAMDEINTSLEEDVPPPPPPPGLLEIPIRPSLKPVATRRQSPVKEKEAVSKKFDLGEISKVKLKRAAPVAIQEKQPLEFQKALTSLRKVGRPVQLEESEKIKKQKLSPPKVTALTAQTKSSPPKIKIPTPKSSPPKIKIPTPKSSPTKRKTPTPKSSPPKAKQEPTKRVTRQSTQKKTVASKQKSTRVKKQVKPKGEIEEGVLMKTKSIRGSPSSSEGEIFIPQPTPKTSPKPVTKRTSPERRPPPKMNLNLLADIQKERKLKSTKEPQKIKEENMFSSLAQKVSQAAESKRKKSSSSSSASRSSGEWE